MCVSHDCPQGRVESEGTDTFRDGTTLLDRTRSDLFLYLLPQLAYCIVQFLEKDPTLTEPVSANQRWVQTGKCGSTLLTAAVWIFGPPAS